MPDIRQIALLMPDNPGRVRGGRFLSRAKWGIRRAIAASANTPLKHLYRAVYRAHVRLAVRVAGSFPLTRSVYVSRSLARNEITYGVSDVDMVIVGEWPEEEQIRLMRRLGVLTKLSPLYDSGLWQQVHHRESLRELWETDYFFQSRFDEGRRQWKLEYGSDLAATLPPVPDDRRAGGYYMEARNWWLHFIGSAFGSGPTAQDEVFRNSIAYKAVTEILEIEHALKTNGFPEESRTIALRNSIERSQGKEHDFLERLEASARRNHVVFRGDLQAESTEVLLPALDRIHNHLAVTPPFKSVGEFEIDANPEEVFRGPQSIALARRLVAQAKADWMGYRAAYLVPGTASFAMDDLLLLIEVDRANPPSFHSLREFCKSHERWRSQSVQRIVPYLLGPTGACQLQFVSFDEMWRVLLFPPSTPDVFTLIQWQEFVVDGAPSNPVVKPVWSRFAYDLAVEEVNVRRSVLSKVTPDVFPSPLEILRNVWRHLQLEVVVRTADRGCVSLPLSSAAVRRGLEHLGLSDDGLLLRLQEAYVSELQRRPSSIREMIPELIVFLKSFC